jgi:hypothetical protein
MDIHCPDEFVCWVVTEALTDNDTNGAGGDGIRAEWRTDDHPYGGRSACTGTLTS